jgi:hypothetical protein
MGAVKRDVHKKGREYHENYPYEAAGIAALLRDINRLSESRWYNGDIDATTILADLKHALDSSCLTPRMRQVVALYYFAQMTEEEVAELIGVNRVTVNEALETALERVSTFMEYGYTKPTNARTDALLTPTHPFLEWINEVASGTQPVYSFSEDITHWLASKGDKKAQETIRQKTDGYTYLPVYEKDCEEYPPYTDDQFRWKDRRMSFVSEVYPTRDTVGFRKVATKLEDNNNDPREWNLERKRLFI